LGWRREAGRSSSGQPTAASRRGSRGSGRPKGEQRRQGGAEAQRCQKRPKHFTSATRGLTQRLCVHAYAYGTAPLGERARMQTCADLMHSVVAAPRGLARPSLHGVTRKGMDQRRPPKSRVWRGAGNASGGGCQFIDYWHGAIEQLSSHNDQRQKSKGATQGTDSSCPFVHWLNSFMYTGGGGLYCPQPPDKTSSAAQ